jgi:phosphopantetheinyl transferase
MPLLNVHACLLECHRGLLDRHRHLPDDEQARAARFRIESAREEYLLGRLLLRGILAEYLGAEPGPLAYGPFGKPALPGSNLEFNLSHSHGRLLVAVCADTPVGIDIEHVDPGIDPVSLARTGLPAADLDALLALPPEARHELFYRLWTRREAALKALGTGLGRAPEALLRQPLGNGVERLLMADGHDQVVVCELPAAAGFRAAVALAGGPELPEIILHDTD